MREVTRLLQDINQGDPHASAELLPLVYRELRKLAAARMASESMDHTLQATALVHEAYLRLVDLAEQQSWNSRGHFFAAAAESMRRILVESARRKQALRNGGTRVRENINLSEVAATDLVVPRLDDMLLSLDDALNKLEAVDPSAAILVKLRYFTGLTLREAAEMLDVSPRKADLLWAYARAWLRRELDA